MSKTLPLTQAPSSNRLLHRLKHEAVLNIQQFPDLEGTFCFALPTDLLLILSQTDRLAAIVTVSTELELSKVAGRYAIGFRDGWPIVDPWLSARWGVTAHRRALVRSPLDDSPLQSQDRSLSPAGPAALTYLGWLFTNPDFLRDLHNVRSNHPELFSAQSWASLPVRNSVCLGDLPGFSGWEEVEGAPNVALNEFLVHWRIEQMSSPISAEPLRNELSFRPRQVQSSPLSASCTFSLTDISPVPDRDLLRELLEQRLSSSRSQAPHLKNWFEIVSRDTSGKRQFDRYGRIYQFQHLMRVLYSRYGAQLARRREAVKNAFAKLFCGGSKDHRE